MAGACPFCRLAGGRESGHVVLEDEEVLAFLDHRPLFAGHVLVVPRSHHQTLADLPPLLVPPLFGAVRRVATAVTTAMDAQGSFVAINNVVSQSVPHLHVHVVPRTRGDGLRGFFWPRQRYGSEEEMARVAARVRAAVEAVAEGRPK